MKTCIHVHSQDSRYDSSASVTDLCKRAKELGYEAITLTDHGTLTGIDDFVKAAKDAGIKPIPGVEAYVQEDNSPYDRLHLILLAKDDLGYQAISKAVTASNRRIDNGGFPRMNKEILETYFGPQSQWHGHVIATSACIGGVLAGILISPESFMEDIGKLQKKQEKYEKPNSESYQRNQILLEQNEKNIRELIEARDQASTLSKKSFKKKENSLKKLEGEEYAEAKKLLDQEKEESKKAKEVLEELKSKIALMKRNSTGIRKKIKESAESQEKYQEIQNQIDEIRTNMVPIEDLLSVVKKEAVWYDRNFGHGNFYVEIQYHGYLAKDGIHEIETMAMPYLEQIAEELSLPIVGANDAHMVNKEDVRTRQIICSLRYASDNWVPDVRVGDDQLYLKSEEELEQSLTHVLSPEKAKEAMEHANQIGDQCHCEFKNGSHYPKYQGLLAGETADGALRRMVYAGIKKKYTGESPDLVWTKEKEQRLEYELSVISEMGYSDYFLIVQDFLAFGRKLGHLKPKDLDYLRVNIKALTLEALESFVDAHQDLPGFAIGAGRGSAAGSEVAYVTGITNVIDPLKYDLLFEREKIAL